MLNRGVNNPLLHTAPIPCPAHSSVLFSGNTFAKGSDTWFIPAPKSLASATGLILRANEESLPIAKVSGPAGRGDFSVQHISLNLSFLALGDAPSSPPHSVPLLATTGKPRCHASQAYYTNPHPGSGQQQEMLESSAPQVRRAVHHSSVKEMREKSPKVAEIPFNSTNKYQVQNRPM